MYAPQNNIIDDVTTQIEKLKNTKEVKHEVQLIVC